MPPESLLPATAGPAPGQALPELLAPAGDFEKLKTAIHYGADAVYLGGRDYSLRTRAGNFDAAGLERAIAYAHRHGVRAYVTVNIFAHNRDLAGLPEHLGQLARFGADGLIVADPGVLAMARRQAPELPLHLSTQANVTNLASARFWASQGVRRLNLARELSLAEIREIRQAVAVELEIFVHGALCISYSGRCLLSLYLTGRHPNRGDCAQPCRYRYRLLEEKRPGLVLPVEEDDRGTYIFNAKDLCLLQRLPDLIRAGADALKIEGRMKSVFYLGTVVRLYRAALDFWHRQGMREADSGLPPVFAAELAGLGSRGLSENFLPGRPGREAMRYAANQVPASRMPAGIVREPGPCPLVESRNPLAVGEELEYLCRQGLATRPGRITAIHDRQGNGRQRVGPGQQVRLTLTPSPRGWLEGGLLRKRAGMETPLPPPAMDSILEKNRGAE